MEIEFKDIGVDDEGILGVTSVDDSGSKDLRFGLPERFQPASDLIALALTPLIGTKYQSVAFDLPVSDQAQLAISKIAQAEVSSRMGGSAPSSPAGKAVGFNFSGGFDSLAALAVVPDNTKLVSLDFGGAFARERAFFEQFDTSIVTTNFRAQGFASNHWTFMGIGPILLRDYLGLGSYGFGSILEASGWNLVQHRFMNRPQPVFAAAGLRQLNPLLGLTEIGAVMLLAHNFPDRAAESLRSLAAAGSEKFSRKAMIYNLVLDLIGSDLERLPSEAIAPEFEFGSRLPSDFRALFLLKRGGLSLAQQSVDQIPEEIVQFVDSRSMTFFEKLNPIFVGPLGLADKQLIYSQCLAAGIEPYGEEDWREYRESIAMLTRWHPSLS